VGAEVTGGGAAADMGLRRPAKKASNILSRLSELFVWLRSDEES